MSALAPKAVILALSLASAGLLPGLSPCGAADSAAFSVEPITGIAGNALPVSVQLPEGLEARREDGPVFVMFKDVPAEIAFSAGFRARQAWLISIEDLGGLMLLSRPGFSQVVEMEAVLHRGREQDHLTHAVRIDLTEPLPEDAKAAVGVTGAFPAPLTQPEREPSASLAQPEIAELLHRAEALLQSGDFESARLIYSALADDGLAEAAMLMARTFDPDVLKGRFIVGMSPDAEQAMLWYRRAMALGDDGARRRLQLLAGQQQQAPP